MSNDTMVNLSTLSDEQSDSCGVTNNSPNTSLHYTLQNIINAPPSMMQSINANESMQSIGSEAHIVNMREVDADILELGVEEKRRADISDFDENGHRSVRAESFCSLEGVAGEDDADHAAAAEGDSESKGDSSAPISSITSSKSLKHVGSMPKIAEDSSHPLHDEKDQDDYFTADIPEETKDENAAAVLKHQKGTHARCNSFERRSRESAQFALVVGENSNLLLNKIIEEDSSSDFDDDDIDEEVETAVGDVSILDECAPSPIASPMDHVQSIRMSSLAIHPPFVDWKFTRQYSSGINFEKNHDKEELGYKGIRTSLLEITQRGVSRGNYAQLHRKAWLEVSDKHHRYGKNLRMYYKQWESLGHPFSMFFDWLDSKGEAEGNPLPDLPECPRSVLDSDTVLYILDPEISNTYALEIVADQNGNAIVLDRTSKRPVCTGKEGWIFVLRDHVMYGSQKVTATGGCSPVGAPSTVKQRFHHSSFFGGKAVASAGIFLTNDQGRLTDLWPHSGHYRPGEAHMQRALFFMQQQGVDLSTFEVDMQQIFKVCRKKSPKEKAKKKDDNDAPASDGEEQQNPQEQEAQPKKAKKTECLLNMGGFEVACFLAHKARWIEKGVFHQIHKIRKIPHEQRGNVSAALKHANANV
ncbi:hypothetical protein ACHAWO_004851 [Cyclotella atomus]|uniref:Uncharacterized protein n=1 Tax=Cyclotella atomus TaxID=382360 RepID=A0ABD3PSY9_9STRA